MRNVRYVGMCWVMTLGMVAVALAQQPVYGPTGQTQVLRSDGAVPLPPAAAPAAQPGAINAPLPAVPAPAAIQERSMMRGEPSSGGSTMGSGQPKGELGVFMAESGGAGVQIVRITPGSAAEQAGLRTGDVILQVNGRGASTPQKAAQIIREVPIGQTASLMVWRDGDQRQMQVTMQPVRERARELDSGMSRETRDESYEVGFHSDGARAGGESSGRIMRLEQQIASLTQELQQMRQDIAQLRAGGVSHTAGFGSDNQGAASSTQPAAPPAAPPAAAPSATPAPPGFGQTEERSSATAIESAKSAPPAPAPSDKPAAPGAKSEAPSNDLFGAPSAAPKSDQNNKAGSDAKTGTDKKTGSDTKTGNDSKASNGSKASSDAKGGNEKKNDTDDLFK